MRPSLPKKNRSITFQIAAVTPLKYPNRLISLITPSPLLPRASPAASHQHAAMLSRDVLSPLLRLWFSFEQPGRHAVHSAPSRFRGRFPNRLDIPVQLLRTFLFSATLPRVHVSRSRTNPAARCNASCLQLQPLPATIQQLCHI